MLFHQPPTHLLPTYLDPVPVPGYLCPPMSEITIEKTAEDAASRSLRVTVPVDRVQAAENKAVAFYAKRARIPGFRPGKAPAAVVKKRFDEAIKQSVLEEVIRESWRTAQTDENLKPIADPSIRNLKFQDGSPIEFDLVVEVRPEITLGRTTGFALSRTVRPVGEAEIEEQVQRLRERAAQWLPVEGAQPAPGHMVRIEVAPIEDGKVGEASPYSVVLGQGQAVPALEEAIMRMQPGATDEVEIRFPDDHADVARRGQTRKVRITLHDVKRQELPPLDDTFAREVGDFDDLAALRAAIRTDREAEAQREADASLRSSLVNELVSANNVPAPETLVHRFLHASAEMYRIPADQLPAFEREFHQIAEAQVRRDLVLDAIVERDQIKASEAEIDERISAIASARNVAPGEVYGQLQKAGRLAELSRSIVEEKVFAQLLAQSTVVEAST